ncbi:ABC transporter substrate-binding protein [Pseudovibrio ascidiaceicola]|uniref:ABC transporter substrate-binding protein n=1 Tax=Pseudovibrio ascidiaceicola TaxID=285279 RepID=UPI000D686190|nr:ABC transporter substrate-binding protein [Pseudovibrio ascidiaceicola]
MKSVTLTSIAALTLPFLAANGWAYNEAPMLKQLVEAGQLPPVEERLPKNPRVIPVYDSIGTYGGVMKRAFKGPSDRWGPTKLMEERVVETYMDGDKNLSLVPGWVGEYSVSEDARDFTFTIREGLRWSDGAPVTTRDVRFWYEDVFLNEDLMPSIKALYTSNGVPMKLSFADDYTFTVSFEKPYPLFLTVLAKESTGRPGLDRPGFIEPFHYLKDYHPAYADPTKLEAAIAKYGAKKWTDLWDSKGQIQAWWFNPDMPVLTAWRVKTPPPSDTVVMERNPYYYGVDAEGNQLPYIDQIEHRLFQDPQAINFMAIQGEIDLQNRHINVADFTLLKENESKGDYTIEKWTKALTWSIIPNLNSKDKVKQALFEDIRFREALNISVDRETVNELAFSGLGEARQASPISGSPFYDEEAEARWTEYDPDKAAELLDAIGLTEQDGDGYRLMSDGRRLSLVLETRWDIQGELLEVVRTYWQDVGIEVLVRIIDRTLYQQHVDTADFDMVLDTFDRSSVITADPLRFLGRYGFAQSYFNWWSTNGKSGEEPPKDHPIRDVWKAWEGAQTAHSLEEANAYAQQMVTLHKQYGWHVGLVGETPAVYVRKNSLKNFPAGFVHDDALRGVGLAYPQQLYFSQD